MKTGWISILAVAGILLTACHQHTADTDHGHEHESELNHELPAQAITLWGERTELFMEHPPLVVGEPAKFAVHLTDMATFRPLTEGRIVLEMDVNGDVVEFESLAPSRPGIFRVEMVPPQAGRFNSVLRVDAPDCRDVHILGELEVYPDHHAAAEGVGQEEGYDDAITYLKEQQWNSEFTTVLAEQREIPEQLAVLGEVRPRGAGEGSVLSPVRGQVLRSNALPVPGQEVARGEIIAAILPLSSRVQEEADLRLELTQAETELQQATRERERLEGLLAEGVIPARRAEIARADERRALARLQAARERIARYEQTRLHPEDESHFHAAAFQVRAPLSGVVTSVSAVNGGLVEAEQEMARIVDLDRVWVSLQVPESAVGRLADLKGVEVDVPGESAPVILPGPRGRIIRTGYEVNPDTRRFPVILEIVNRDRTLLLGLVVRARLLFGMMAPRLAVPDGALVEDGGQTVVYVHESGEGFVRRPVQTGPSGGGYTAVLAGLDPGERVVSRGAYAVRLASLSSQVPAHGHVH